MDISSLLAQSAPVPLQQVQQNALQQQGEQQNQQAQAAMLPGQMQQQSLALQSAQQQLQNNRRAMGISMLTPILNEPNPDKQQALMKTLVPMFNRYVPDMQLDPESADVSTIRALAQSQISPEKQADMQLERLKAMGGMGGSQGGIFPGQASPFTALMAGPQSQAATPDTQGNPNPGPDAASPNLSPPPQPKPTAVDTSFLNQAKMVDPLAATMAENMIAGTFEPESGKGQNDPTYVRALSYARKADPTFNAQSLLGRPSMVKNSTNGDMYKLETSLNTGMAHLYDLHELAPLTGNEPNSSPALNWLGSRETTAIGLPGAQGISRYRGTLANSAPEIAKYLGGGAATDTSTAEAQGNYADTLPPDTIQVNAKDLGAKMMAKGGSLQNEYNAAMGGAATHKVVQPMTEALYADMQGQPLTQQQRQLVNAHRAESNLPPKTWTNATQQAKGMLKAPSGTPIISSPNDPTFQALPSGASFMSADGRMMVKH